MAHSQRIGGLTKYVQCMMGGGGGEHHLDRQTHLAHTCTWIL